MKLVVAFIVVLFVIAFGGMGYYLYSLWQQAAITPSTLQNPSTNPAQSFGQTTTPAVNPFASPTPTSYQNPFNITSTGSQPYQNPFEKLR